MSVRQSFWRVGGVEGAMNRVINKDIQVGQDSFEGLWESLGLWWRGRPGRIPADRKKRDFARVCKIFLKKKK